MRTFPTWTIVIATTVALLGGLAVLSEIVPDAHAKRVSLPALPSPLMFFAIGVPAYVAEALLFTVVPIELASRFLRIPPLGAAVGVLGYGVAYHWSHGISGIVLASWIALVLNTSYLVLRARSKRTAIASTLGHKIAFLMLAAFGVYVLVPLLSQLRKSDESGGNPAAPHVVRHPPGHPASMKSPTTNP